MKNSEQNRNTEKKKKFKITKEIVWKGIMLVASVLLILTSLAPLFLR